MGRIYQLMSEQGSVLERRMGHGRRQRANAAVGRLGSYQPSAAARGRPDAAAACRLPSADVLALNTTDLAMSRRRLQLAGRALADNDELLDLLQ